MYNTQKNVLIMSIYSNIEWERERDMMWVSVCICVFEATIWTMFDWFLITCIHIVIRFSYKQRKRYKFHRKINDFLKFLWSFKPQNIYGLLWFHINTHNIYPIQISNIIKHMVWLLWLISKLTENPKAAYL